jgi:hypothetical protein
MGINFDEYLLDLLEALTNENGKQIADQLSIHFDISKSISKISNLKVYIQHRLESPWDQIVYLHCSTMLEEELVKKAQYQNELAQHVTTVLGNNSRWFLPVVNTVNRDLYELACRHSRKNKSNDALEEAARTMNKVFSICITDRNASTAESRKWGVYGVVNLLFKTYFKLSSTNLCTNILKSLESADLPSLDEYSISEQVTHKYFVGVMSFFDEKFENAAADLRYHVT